MSESSKGITVRSFFDIEAKLLVERYKIIETLLPNSKSKGSIHNGEEGRYIESLFRDFLNKHLPSNLKAMTGFILLPSTKTDKSNKFRVLKQSADRYSNQLDIIVYDIANYPIYEMVEEFCIVPPEGVVSLISIKKNLYIKDIKKELESLWKALLLCKSDEEKRLPHSAIFSFNSKIKNKKKIFEKLEKTYSKLVNEKINDSDTSSFSSLITEVIILNQFCLFKFNKEHSERKNQARYISLDCEQEPHIAVERILQSILSVYYDKSRGSQVTRPGFISFKKDTFKNASLAGYIPYKVE